MTPPEPQNNAYLDIPELHDLVAEFIGRESQPPIPWNEDLFGGYLEEVAGFKPKFPAQLQPVADALSSAGMTLDRLLASSLPPETPLVVAKSWAIQFRRDLEACVNGVRPKEFRARFTELAETIDSLTSQMNSMKPEILDYLVRSLGRSKYREHGDGNGHYSSSQLAGPKAILFGLGPTYPTSFNPSLLSALNVVRTEALERAANFDAIDRGGGNEGGHRGSWDPAGDWAYLMLGNCMRVTFLALGRTKEHLEATVPLLMSQVVQAAGGDRKRSEDELLDHCVKRFKKVCKIGSK
jgi:hypothetical protein